MRDVYGTDDPGLAAARLGGVELIERVVAQTPGPSRRRRARRLDTGGQPARRRCPAHRQGPARKPVEFGYKAQVVDNADGVVLDHGVVVGNPPDAPMLVPTIGRIAARFGRAPKAVTADRGYCEAKAAPSSLPSA